MKLNREKIMLWLRCPPKFPFPIRRPAACVELVSKQDILKPSYGIPSTHASTVLPLNDGTVLAAWFGGTEEKNKDVRIWYSKRDVFGIWGKPQKITAKEDVAHWNPVLDLKNDGTIRLYFKCYPNIPDWKTYYSDSKDGGVTFSEPVELVEGDCSGGRGPVKNKCLRTKEGLLLAPASSEQNNDFRIFVDVSRDDGETWARTPFIEALNPDGEHVRVLQPTLWQDKKGNVHLLCRTAKDGYVYKSDSFDGGITWNTAYRTKLYNNFSGIDCCTSDDGRIWLLCNPISGTYFRSPLRLLVSCDNGITWLPVKDFERYPFSEYSYPAITCLDDKLYCTYTNDRKNITFIELKI